ncbi:MAG TPA: hypothetical protein VGH44_03715, partial [Candidatus Saccharimonadia bacterium]
GDTSNQASFATSGGYLIPFKRLASAVYALQANSCTTCILQAPTSTAQNTIQPATSAVVGLTVNATNTGTAAQSLVVNQATAADAQDINVTNTSGTSTAGIAVTKTGAGTLTSGLSVTRSTGTLTYGLNLSGAISTDIKLQNSESIDNATNGTVNVAADTGALTLNLTGTAANLQNSAGNFGITSAGALNLNTTGTSATNIGNTTNGTVVSIEGEANGTIGTPSIAIGNGSTNHVIEIGANSLATNSVYIGSTSGAGTTNISSGTGNTLIKASNSNIAAPILSVQQAGGGDASQEFKDATTSWYQGVDTSAGHNFVINSNAAATANGVLGQNYSTTPPTNADSNINFAQGSKFTAGTSGTISSVNVAFESSAAPGSSSFSVAIFADSAGSPGALLGKHTGTSVINITASGGINWNNLSLDSPVSVTSGTIYWLIFQTNDGSYFKTIPGGGNSVYRSGCTVGTWGTSWSGASPTCTTNAGAGTDETGVYAQISVGSLADTFNSPLFSLSTTGAATFRSLSGSTAAFQVQNAGTEQVLNVDTSDNQVSLGQAGTGGVAGKLVINSTNASNSESSFTVSSSQFANIDYTLPSSITTSQCLQSGATTATTLIWGSCAGVTPTLQQVYQASTSTAGITLNNTQNGFLLQNPASSGTGSGYTAFIQNLATGAVDGLDIASAGTGALLKVTDSTATAADVLTVANGGATTFKSQTNSTTALQVQNSSSTSVLTIDTSSNISQLGGLTNPDFESGAVTPWAAKGTCTGGLATDVASPYAGTYDGKCTTSGTNTGMQQTVTLVSGATYYLSAWVKVPTATYGATISVELGATIGGTATPCTTGPNGATSYVLPDGNWHRISCTFKPASSGTNIYIDTTATSGAPVLYVDSVIFQGAGAGTDYTWREGKINLGYVTGPTAFQVSSDTSTAFTIQNAAGAPIFNVNTASYGGGILATSSDSDFEGGIGTWLASGSSTIARDTANAFTGAASLRIATTATNDGATDTNFTFSPIAYVLSFYAKANGYTPTIDAGWVTGGATFNTCTLSPTTLTANWTRYTCQTPTMASGAGTIYIRETTGTTGTFWVDDVRLEPAAAANGGANAATPASIQLAGKITSPLTIQNDENSTNEFQVQANGGAYLLGVDSANKVVEVGNPTTDTTEVKLQLDSYSTFVDNGTCSTTTNQGALYYNTSSNAIRSCVNGAWDDVVTTAGLGIMLFGVVSNSGSGSDPGDLAALSTSGKSGPCKVSAATASTVNIEGCVLYSGGRKRIVAANTAFSVPLSGTNIWVHICMNNSAGNENVPLATAATTETGSLPSFTATSPIVCLADVKVSATTIQAVYDVRPFTTSVKDFVTASTAVGLGWATIVSGSNVIPPGTTTAAQSVVGVVVASNGSTSTTTPNAIIVNSGPTMVKSTAGTAGAIVTQGITTNGYAITGGANTNAYSQMGYARKSFPATACTTTLSAANCDDSLYFFMALR